MNEAVEWLEEGYDDLFTDRPVYRILYDDDDMVWYRPNVRRAQGYYANGSQAERQLFDLIPVVFENCEQRGDWICSCFRSNVVRLSLGDVTEAQLDDYVWHGKFPYQDYDLYRREYDWHQEAWEAAGEQASDSQAREAAAA
jgi:hypothetical protein